MQDKHIAMDDQLAEDLGENHASGAKPALQAKSVPVIEITRFDDDDLPVDTRVLPLHRFL